MSIVPIEALGAAAAAHATGSRAESTLARTTGASQPFAKMLMDGLQHVDEKMAAADAKVRAFALDDKIPLHQVTFALQEARTSLTLMMQVRARLVESFQELSRMQL
jgi:flagellar hook-basal body complex protein FliE